MDELIIRLPSFEYLRTDDIFSDSVRIIELAQKTAYNTVNYSIVYRNWLLGRRIHDEEMDGNDRAEYGLEVIKNLSKQLTVKFGTGYDRSNLYHFLRFYKFFPEIVDASGRQSQQILTWTHYRALLRVEDSDAREWYARESFEQMWTSRTLQRNIASQYYYRLVASQNKQPVIDEMKKITAPLQLDKREFIRNPVIAEFLGFPENAAVKESKLESAILSNLQRFMMELGKGFAFVARQQLIRTENNDYYIDLVFYNYILKCFVLIDLKTDRITHQDVGQLDMYVRMYDELKRTDGDNPTLGILLCSETDADIARYSVLHGNEQLFATKYKLYLPSEEDIRAEIETQKTLFYLQQDEESSE